MTGKTKSIIPQMKENDNIRPASDKKPGLTDIDSIIEPPKPSEQQKASDNVKEKPKRAIDISMILMIFIMVVFGLVVLYSVSAPDAYGQFGDSLWFLRRQLFYTILGFVLMFIVAFIPVDFFKKRWLMFASYIISFALALATLLMGVGREHGASRWINIGPIQLQGSEIIKVALIVFFAGYRSMVAQLRDEGKIKEYIYDKGCFGNDIKAEVKRNKVIIMQNLKLTTVDFLIPIVFCIVVDFIILLQPHLSCFIIIAAVVALTAIASEIPFKSWAIGILILVIVVSIAIPVAFALVPNLYEKITKNYAHVFKRLQIFNAGEVTEEDEELTKDDTRQVDNAHNALGSGGMWGVGLGNSRSKYNYVSEAQNDYIFSIYIEETGFVGGVILIMMYMTMFLMCMRVCWRAKDLFSRTLAMGCTALIFVEVLLNLAVELKVSPSTGVTLPFVSYGGTAQVSLLIAYGFILSVSRSGVRRDAQKKSAPKLKPAKTEA